MDLRNTTIFQHDGARCHTAKSVQQWLQEQGVEVLEPWSGNSPDLNPIENCWDVVKNKVRSHKPSSHAELIKTIKQVWTQQISATYCEKLVTSMPRRIQAILKAKGKHTKY